MNRCAICNSWTCSSLEHVAFSLIGWPEISMRFLLFSISFPFWKIRIFLKQKTFRAYWNAKKFCSFLLFFFDGSLIWVVRFFRTTTLRHICREHDRTVRKFRQVAKNATTDRGHFSDLHFFWFFACKIALLCSLFLLRKCLKPKKIKTF